ncbi:hypothetical protein [Nodularia chucula]|uniref:hypothetical protein n=1 Tax=Nodularia chucula TaxID=3093667 RepID=UPI0039C61853
MKSLLLTSLLYLSLLLLNFSVVAQSKPSKPICNYPVEEDSVFTKQFIFKKFGVSMELPENLVSMLRNNGEIEVLDRGTYKMLQCPVNQRLGNGYSSYIIRWADSTQYQKKLNIKDNVDLLLRSDLIGYKYFYTMILRVVNSKGQKVDIFISVDDSIDNNNFEQYKKEYLELGTKVVIFP